MENLKLWEKFRLAETPEEKKELRGMLMECYIDLITVLSWKMFNGFNQKVEFDDIYQNAALGLADAIDKFDPEKGASFKTFASFRIKGSIIDEIRNFDEIPRSIRDKQKELLKMFDGEFSYEQKIEKIEKERKVTRSEAIKLLKGESVRAKLSIEDLAENFEDIYHINPDLSVKIDEGVEYNQSSKIIKEAIDNCLNENQKNIIERHFFEEVSLHEISIDLNLSGGRISQLKSVALKKLQVELSKKQLDYIDLVS